MDISLEIMNNLKHEYYDIYSEFYQNNKYREMKNISHHGNNRLDHINRVGKMTFYLSKAFEFDYVSSTRGALMHDFFSQNEIDSKKMYALKLHPQIALKNSKKFFKVNEIEEDIIANHMFPITINKPKYKESKLVCICDKLVSGYEFARYKVSRHINLFIIFVFNTLSL